MPTEAATKHAFLAMPGYGCITPGAAVGLYEASKGAVTIGGERTPIAMHVKYETASLLAHNFNELWCMALNRHVDGKPVDYFAMLHDDIEPQRGWLDVAIEELEARNLDVLGVVVPLKITLGLTSIALDRADGDTWRPQCRLTMKEVYDLPETFTSEDVGHPLLINTGCWVCRFDFAWAEKFTGFTINDRIVRDSTGHFKSDVEPEDWYFSRRCHEIGLRIGATRKVALDHVGMHRFPNRYQWGSQAFDSAFVPESIVPIYGNSTQPTLAEVDKTAAIPLEV